MSTHTPAPWLAAASASSIVGWPIVGPGGRTVASVHTYRGNTPEGERANAEAGANARLIAASPDLLALAHQYASECGDCGGTRVCPDDEPCTECAFIWAVIDQAEGRA